MSVSNLFKRIGLQWMPDADAVGAPEGALLRADNLVPDPLGALALRRGSTRLYSSLAGDSVNSLHTVELTNGTSYRVAGVDDKIYVNGVKLFDSVTGSGDIVFGDDGQQIFMARGSTAKKYDGTDSMNWGLTAPAGKATLTAATAVTSTVCSFEKTESPATTAPEGTIADAADYGTTSDSAKTLTVNANTARGAVQKLWTSDQDFFNIVGTQGASNDIFDMWIKMSDPAHVQKITVMFGCGDSSTVPFDTDRFEFTFDFTKTAAVELKDPDTISYDAYEAAVSGILNKVDPKEATNVQSPKKVKETIKGVGNKKAPKSGPRPEPAVWGHLSVTRGQFKRAGSTAGRGWNTIRGFKVVVENQKGKTSETTTFSDAIFIGGGAAALTGTYKCVIRGARVTDKYIELSPPSAESNSINLNHQILTVTIPSTTLTTLDPQIDELWIYLFGGMLDTYYRFEITGTAPASGQTLEELTTPDGSDMNDADERARITSHGMTMQAGSGSADIVVTIGKSEVDALTEWERLEPYQSGPPDNIIAIAGPWNGRMFCMTSEGYVYPSSNRSPSSFNSLQVIDLTKYGDPLWMVKTTNGIVCGCEKDIILLAGSGDDSDDLTVIDLYPQPLNVANPPLDKCVASDGNAIFYRSADGLMSLTGGNLQPMPPAGTSLLWRGMERHGVQGLNITTGRFRCTVDNLMFYILAPEGSETSGNVIYRFSPAVGKWSRLTFPQVDKFYSLYTEPSGALVAGDNAGNLWQLDIGDQDDIYDIPATLLTPVSDGGSPLAYKESHDFQIHCDTGGDTGTLTLFKDGSFNASDPTYSFYTTTPGVYRMNLNSFGRFLKAQIQLTGSFSRFNVSYFDMTYRIRPQHSMKLDTGYLLPPEPGDMIWLQEVEFDANAFGDVTFELWLEDVLAYSTDITVTDSIRTPYRLPLPRGSKAYRPRLVFYSADSSGEGSVGFECYSVRVRARGTGNQGDSRGYYKVWPVGEAP